MRGLLILFCFLSSIVVAYFTAAAISDAIQTDKHFEDAPSPHHDVDTNDEHHHHRDDAADSNNRKLWCINTNGSSSSTRIPKWHPVYSVGWTNGYCRYNIDCDSPGYASELECCKFSYAGQISGHCISRLPNPPTTSPTGVGGLGIYYPDYSLAWNEGYCINTRPKPSGWPTFSSMLACCKAAYAGQMSGKCISMLPSPPTISPTNSARIADFWYPQYELSWDQAGCSNALPLPYNNINDRPKYESGESCCAAAYGGQVSMTCICGLDNPPLGCPGVVEYRVTTTTTTITSTLDLGDLVDPYNQADLIQILESTIAAIVQASLGADGGTVEKVIILSISGEPVDRRRALFLRRELSSHVSIQFQVLVNDKCLRSNCQNIQDAIRDDVKRGLTNLARLQTALRQSGNTALQSVIVEEIMVRDQVTSTQATATAVEPPPTKRPTTSLAPPPTISLMGITGSSSPSTSPSKGPTSSPSVSPTSSPTSSPETSPPSTSPSKGPTSSPSVSPTSSPTSSPETSPPSTSPSKGPTSSPLPGTDWALVSLLLADENSDLNPLLPTIPSHEDVSTQLYTEGPSASDSYPFILHKISDFPSVAGLCNDEGVLATAMAGPKEICTADNCRGPAPDFNIGEEQCRAIINSDSIQLQSKFGTYWAKTLNTPAWMQFIFPRPVPEGTQDFVFSFELDHRYRPEMYGGNPCSTASSDPEHKCQICKVPGNSTWDYEMEAGVHVLWTAAGRSQFVITGPYELGTAYDADDFKQTLHAPEDMDYAPGEFVIVTFLIFSQYSAVGEVSDPSSCSVAQSTESGFTLKDKTLMINEVSLMYRSGLEILQEPQLTRPRLYGTDAEWLNNHVTPFFNAPCDPNTAISNGGWFETKGYLSIKSHFDLAARGYISCQVSEPSNDIGSWSSLSPYFTADEIPNQSGGYRALHLLRRLWACASANNGDYSSCEFNATETNRLATSVVTKEMERFASTTWTCGAACGGNGGTPVFDLTTAEQVSFFVHFYDVMLSEGSILTEEQASAVQATLRNMILLFENAFWSLDWRLWNGNNWTPHLCLPALEWAIVFWHEDNELASKLLGIVNDIMWLHRDFYTEDGVYTEGIAEYAFMSMNGQMAMSALSRASFGFAPAAIDVEKIQLAATYFLAGISSDGYMFDLGDSHKKRGWSSPMAVVEAAIAPAIVDGDTVSETSINPDQARAFSAMSYGSGSVYSNPWRIRGAILQFDSLSSLRSPPLNQAQPLGPKSISLFSFGGYARILTPLLTTDATSPICFNNKCIDPDLPSLWDGIPYSSISLQARPNTFAHSEVDFGSINWSAWGSRLLSEFGYGTIATSVNEYDMRRYMQLDNNPAGHNTVVIQEAFQPGSDKINFSQLNYVAGTLGPEISYSDGSSCVLMDGSEVYGASRPDGWLDLMKRYVCTLGIETLVLDLVQTKENRASLNLYGSQYGGPDFTEPSPASQSLTIEEYFYVDAEEDVIENNNARPSSMKWCNHVDVEFINDNDHSSLALHPLCGIGGFRSADGMGVISGFSLAGNGHFEYDGLITTPGIITPIIKKRRFRFVTDQAVDASGDVRVFVLTPSLASDTQQPEDMALTNCSNEHGCGADDSLITCSCIQMCMGQTLKHVTVANGDIVEIEDLGPCSATSTTTNLFSNDLLFGGNGVSFPTDTEVVLESTSSTSSEFGVVITKHAFNADDVDFKVDYTQTSYANVQDGYESQLCVFFAPTGTYPEDLLQNDNDFGDFTASTVGYFKSKVYTIGEQYTWFDSGTSESTHSSSTNTKHLELSLRIRRLENQIYTYYKVPGSDAWVHEGQAMDIPEALQDVPVQFGFRVKKGWRMYHQFSVQAFQQAGGSPLSIATRPPTTSPTETRTWIVQETNYKEPVCPTTLDRSSVSGYEYEVRGVGGGGAMSGLSLSPWDDLWFVGTDMGTLFRSTDSGKLWYPVSHYEAKYHSRLVVSATVGYTSNPGVVVHAACHENVADRNCVAQRSVDSGITWSPIDITGSTRVDSEGNPVLDEIPLSWYGSLVRDSGIIYCAVFGSGNLYKSSDDGATWSLLSLPSNTTNPAVGLYLDESLVTSRYIYFATSHGIYMWKEGFEADARAIYTTDGSTPLQSFTGARAQGSTKLMLSFVDTNTTACQDDHDENCGYVHTFHLDLDVVAAETHSFTFTKTNQRGFRVASSRTDSDLIYVTGARGWPDATGTQVWVGAYDYDQNSFGFVLKFRQYPLWDADKLDYSGVGLDVGYWDGGYYTWNVKPNDFNVAGGSGNFFLHVTRNGGDNWDSPFTEYADACNTNDERLNRRRWRSTGLEMTSVRWLKFNPYNTNFAYASVADIRMLRSDDGGHTFEITGGDNTDDLFQLNTVYDYDFAGLHTVFAVGGNFHDWPHAWYKNLRRGAGGVFVSFNSGDNWHRIGSSQSSNCDDNFFNVDCSLGDDMVRQILSVHWDVNVGGGTLYVGTQASGAARLEGLNDIFATGTIEQMQDLQWEFVNSGLGSHIDRIIPEIKERNGKLYCLLTGNAPDFTNNADVGIYMFDHASSSWTLKKGIVNHHSDIAARFGLWAYPTSFDLDQSGNMWLVDIETNGNYLASGVWKSSDDGVNWDRLQQFTFPYHITCVGDRVYASGARSISHIGNAGWGDGGAMYTDDGGASWQKNEAIPLLSNLNSVVVDPADNDQVFYTFFGGGMLHGPKP